KMNRALIYAAGLLIAIFLAGCQTIPPGAERGPHGTIAYDVLVEASAPGARIQANGQDVGATPVHLKIFGDPDGTFHDVGYAPYGPPAYGYPYYGPPVYYYGPPYYWGPEFRFYIGPRYHHRRW